MPNAKVRPEVAQQISADNLIASACRQFSTEAVALFTSFEKLTAPLEAAFTDAEAILEKYLQSEEIVAFKQQTTDLTESPHELPIEGLTNYIMWKQSRDEAFFLRSMNPRSQLLSLVAIYESFLRRLLRAAFAQTPSVIDQIETTIQLRDIRHYPDKESIIELGIERCIDSVLRESAVLQIHKIGRLFNVDSLFERASDDASQFVEIMERRNIIAHCGGVASPYYIAQCQKYGAKNQTVVGESLIVSTAYFRSAVECLLCTGIKIAQFVWRAALSRTDRRDKINSADRSLRQISYWLLELERYELAVALLEFAVSINKTGRGYIARVFLINLAQAYKWMGNTQKCLEILCGEDWDDADTAFRLSVALLNDDFAASHGLMIRAGRDGILKEAAFRNWPIYKEFRKTIEFREAFKVLYEKEYDGLT